MSLKTLIVDDEPIARKVLREELEAIADVEIVGEADNGSTALEKMRSRSESINFRFRICDEHPPTRSVARSDLPSRGR